jgi:hypothetical protein
MIELTEEQRQEWREPEPTALDPQTRTTNVRVRKDVFERMRRAMEEVDPSLYEFEEIPPP